MVFWEFRPAATVDALAMYKVSEHIFEFVPPTRYTLHTAEAHLQPNSEAFDINGFEPTADVYTIIAA